MPNNTLIPNLFRTEFSKMVSVLLKTFGLSNIQWAEDVVSETFIAATETWGLNGTPSNPTAWLYKVAKNKALDAKRREGLFEQKISKQVAQVSPKYVEIEIDLSENNITDSQLQMLFIICNPEISNAAQIALALRILCGFGIDEIATAFLTNKAVINKRLTRAKSVLRTKLFETKFSKITDIPLRLDNVLAILYLLFNEGYYSSHTENRIRKELCLEAMRLTYFLVNHQPTNTTKSNALLALFCFHSSRFDARTNENGDFVDYRNQDASKWNSDLIKKGEHYLGCSGKGDVHKYHLEAIIGYWHTRRQETNEKWDQILQCYNRLLQIEYSPVVALNRTYAVAMVYGNEVAIKEAKKINLENNHLYHLLLAELFKPTDKKSAEKHLKKALTLARTDSEKRFIEKKIDS